VRTTRKRRLHLGAVLDEHERFGWLDRFRSDAQPGFLRGLGSRPNADSELDPDAVGLDVHRRDSGRVAVLGLEVDTVGEGPALGRFDLAVGVDDAKRSQSAALVAVYLRGQQLSDPRSVVSSSVTIV